jgi:hypothetical protein
MSDPYRDSYRDRSVSATANQGIFERVKGHIEGTA